MIGLEVHAELDTDSKLFCTCPTKGDDSPNTRICPVCLGHPGSKPVVNEKAIGHALKLSLALGCRIADKVIFSRKSYFYPDLSKNYQITQYEIPIGSEGHLKIGEKDIGITRVHIEEDPASLIHPGGMGKAAYSLVDYNRSGNPLCEIVTKPELSSPEEAREFMKRISTLLEYLGIFDSKHNILKADANISIREKGFTRVEVKNISGFKEIERALSYEIERQKASDVMQETRAWDAEKGITFSLRKKETEDDYGYILDPDLVPIPIENKEIEQLKKRLPELPSQKYDRYVKDYGISHDDAYVLTDGIALTRLFENTIKKVDPLLAAKWIRREVMRVLNYNKIDISEMEMDEKEFIKLLSMVESKKITEKIGQKVIEKLVVQKIDVERYIDSEGLMPVSDAGELERYCREAILENPKVVDDYKGGKEVALNFLVGQAMKKSKGKADAKTIKDIILTLI
jgi:aspartyl-tRNA(Asn)/glutamyl-tRNA(Gln) amidotransferase subunit B